MKIALGIATGIIIALILASSVWAADVSTATYKSVLVASNATSVGTKSFFFAPLSRPSMIDNDFLNDAGFDAVICASTDCADGTERPFMGGPAQSFIEYYKQFNNTGSAFNTYTSQANDLNPNDVIIFDASAEVGDINYFGFDSKQRILDVHLGTAGVGTWVLAWEYSRGGSAWASLSGVSDESDAYTKAGESRIDWDMPTDWATSSVNSQAAYWVRSRIDTLTGTTTLPIGDYIEQEAGFWTFTATTTPQQFAKNSQQSLSFYAGGGTDIVDHYPIVASSISTNAALGSPGTGDWTVEWTGYYGNDAINDILESVGSSNMSIDWTCTGAACGPTIDMQYSTSDCNLNAEDSAWTNRPIKIEIIRTVGQCGLEIDDVVEDTDATVAGSPAFTGVAWRWNLENSAYIDYASTTFVTAGTIPLLLSMDSNIMATSSNYVSATPQLQNQGSCASCDGVLAFDFDESAIGNAGAFASTFEQVVSDPAGGVNFAPLIPTDTPPFASTTSPNQNMIGGDTLQGAASLLNVPVSMLWTMALVSVMVPAMVGFYMITKGSFIAAMIGADIIMFIAISPGVAIWPWWVLMAFIPLTVGSWILDQSKTKGV